MSVTSGEKMGNILKKLTVFIISNDIKRVIDSLQ